MSLPDPQQALKLTDAAGRLTPDGWMYIRSLIAYIRALEARIEALEP